MVVDLRNPEDRYPVYHESCFQMIAYFMGKRIVRDHLDNLYFEIIPKSCATTVDVLNRDRLTPISELPKSEQAAIREYVKDVD